MTSGLPASITTVLFDVGNTLHHLDHAFIAHTITRHGHPVEQAAVAVAEYAGKAAVDAEFRARRAGLDAGHQLSYFGTILEALQVSPAAVEPILTDLYAENMRASLWRVMDPETPRVIADLRRRGYTLAVVSNADGRVAASLAASGIAAEFVTIVDSHVVGVEKPAAGIFEIALQSCRAQAANTIYVGDIYEIDVRGARNAGITPVLIDPLGRYGDVDCLRIASLSELPDLLRR